jgi:hypothetical protein
MRSFILRALAVAAVATSLLGSTCSSTGSGSGSTTTQSATGIWTGTDSVSGGSVVALINSGGQATFIYGNGEQFTGSAQVSGATLAATVDGYSNFFGSAFSDGSTYGIGTVNGTVSTASSITATLSFTTNDSTAISGNWSLTYSAASTTSSSTAAVSGNYTDTVTGAVLSITSNGVMTSQSASNGCVLNGSISTNDSTTNIYEVAYSFASCTGTSAVLNGVQFTGLATPAPINSSLSSSQLTMVVSGTASSTGTKYGIVSYFNAT